MGTFLRHVVYVDLCNLQNVLGDLATVNIRISLGSGFSVGLGSGSRLVGKFANCACGISKVHSAVCKLRRFTNSAQRC